MKKPRMYAFALFVGAVFFLLTHSPEALAGGVDVHIGIGLPFPGYVLAPPPPPPPVVVVPPPYGYRRPFVVHYDHYRRHHLHQNHWGKSGNWGHARRPGRHW